MSMPATKRRGGVGQRAFVGAIPSQWAFFAGLSLIVLGFCSDSVETGRPQSGIACFALATVSCFLSPLSMCVDAWQRDMCSLCAVVGSTANLSLMILVVCRVYSMSSANKERIGLGSFAIVAACSFCLLLIPWFGINLGGATINRFLAGYYLWVSGLILSAISLLNTILSQTAADEPVLSTEGGPESIKRDDRESLTSEPS